MNDHERRRHACRFVEHFPVVDPNHATMKHFFSRQGHSFSIAGGFILLCFYFPALVKCCNESKFGEYVSKGVAQPPDSLFAYGSHCLFTKGFSTTSSPSFHRLQLHPCHHLPLRFLLCQVAVDLALVEVRLIDLHQLETPP